MWIDITIAQIEARLTKPELAALTSAARQDAQTAEGLVAAARRVVVAEVRGYVGACERNRLGAGETIPDELESAALALIRRYLFTRLPGMRSLYDDIRQRETEDAIQRLRDTAACRFAIVPPDDLAEAQPAGPSVTLISSRERIAKREDLSGL